MLNEFSRAELILGADAMDILRRSRVAVFGVGGVGGYAVEALARCGVGTIDLIDNDCVSLTNINRQIIALHSTLGRPKVDVMAERISDICPQTVVNRHNCFFLPETAERFDFSQYSYVIDCIDTVSGKLEIVLRCQAAGVPVISSMGTGNKLDPYRFQIADISKTTVCPLARAMRGLLRKKGVEHLKVVYSDEPPFKPEIGEETIDSKHPVPASLSFVPPVAGLMLAGEVIRDLIGGEKHGA